VRKSSEFFRTLPPRGTAEPHIERKLTAGNSFGGQHGAKLTSTVSGVCVWRARPEAAAPSLIGRAATTRGQNRSRRPDRELRSMRCSSAEEERRANAAHRRTARAVARRASAPRRLVQLAYAGERARRLAQAHARHTEPRSTTLLFYRRIARSGERKAHAARALRRLVIFPLGLNRQQQANSIIAMTTATLERPPQLRPPSPPPSVDRQPAPPSTKNKN